MMKLGANQAATTEDFGHEYKDAVSDSLSGLDVVK